ncbi:MAG: hypothetical protein KF858_05310 [Candidatus Sumerlaeia bacterium]|nr:hypothetical protein [Candidatus Sumerlaeia bacterium]
MKRKVLAILAGVAILGVAIPASAHRFHRVDSSHPMRVVGYAVHGVGTALEYWVMRPIHKIVSKDDFDIVFGHKARVHEEKTYDEWLHADYAPSIAVERATKTQMQRGTAPR